MAKQIKIHGRPKGARNQKTILTEIANTRVTAHENGQKVKRPMLELVFLALRKKAIEEGNRQAIDFYLQFLDQNQPAETDDDSGYLVVPESPDKEEFIARMEERIAANPYPPDMKVDEPEYT